MRDYLAPIAVVKVLQGTGFPLRRARASRDQSSFMRRTWLKKLRIAGVGVAGGGSWVSNRSASNAIRSGGQVRHQHARHVRSGCT